MYHSFGTGLFLLFGIAALGADPAAELDVLRQQLKVYEQKGEYAKAESLLPRLEHLAESLPFDSAYRGTVWNDIAHVHHEACRVRDAERWYRRALSQFERSGPPEGVETVLANLAVLHLETGNTAQARRSVRRLEAVTAGGVLPPFRRMRMETVRGRLAALEGNFATAQSAIAEAQKAAELAGNPGAMSSLYYDVGVLYLRQKELDRAADAFAKARSSIEQNEGPDSPRLIGVLFNIAGIHARHGWHSEALAASERALQQSLSSFAPDSPALGVAWQVHADVLQRVGRKKESKAAVRQADSILARNGGPVVDRSTIDVMALRQGR